MRKVFQYGNLR